MPPDPEHVIHQLATADHEAITAIVERARADGDVTALVAAALHAPDPAPLLADATGAARTTRDRQVVAIARARVAGRHDLVDALARDHLTDHPTSVLVAWIAATTAPHPSARPDTGDPS